MMELMSLQEEIRELACSLCLSLRSQARKTAFIRHRICQHLDLGLSSLKNCEKQASDILLQQPQQTNVSLF